MKKPLTISLFFTIALLFSLSFGVESAKGAPASLEPHLISQPDGTQFIGILHGDEWYNWVETETGYGIARNPETGFWEYLVPLPSAVDDTDRVRPSAIDGTGVLAENRYLPVGLVDPVEEGIPRGLRPERRSFPGEDEAFKRQAGFSPAVSDAARAPAMGSFPTLVILAAFTDRGGSYGSGGFHQQFFGPSPSVRDYFDDVSYGNMTIAPAFETNGTTNDGIIGWLNLGYDHPDKNDPLIPRLAIEAADPYINYASYDANNDRVLSTRELAIVVVAAGFERSYGGSYTPSVWAHVYHMGGVGYPVVDGVQVQRYVMIGEIHANHIATIGIMAHELGHSILGWPDLYDTDGSSYGIGCWGLMSYGSWGRKSSDPYIGISPTHPLGYLKLHAGWIDGSTIVDNGTYSFAKVDGSGEGIRRIGTTHPNQYFILENRQTTGYDGGLYRWIGSSGGGLLVTHIDESVQNNREETHKLADVEEANEGSVGYSQLDTQESWGNRSHLFWSGNAESFSDSSTPNAKLYDGTVTGISVTNISRSGNSMTADVATSCTDIDGDGYNPCEGDCDENDPAINPGVAEVCDDQVDNNCDGRTDQLDKNCRTAPLVWYVDRNATGTGDGLSWQNAFAHPQDGVNTALSGEQVWVAKGTYRIKSQSDTVVLTMADGVEIYGGFHGVETDISQRDHVSNLTVLDGEDVAVHVVIGADNGRIDGFTVTGGNANDTSGPGQHGGGMYNDNCSPSVINCTFTENKAIQGGGIYNSYGSPTISDCTITENLAEWGAGMYNNNSSPTVSNAIFKENATPEGGGGGMYNIESAASVARCIFSKNTAINGGGMLNVQSSPKIYNCIFKANTAYQGGGITNSYSSPSIVNSLFTGNAAYDFTGTGNYIYSGGGVLNSSGSPAFINCTFTGNFSSGHSGGMYNDNSSPILTNCILWGNSSPSYPEINGEASITHSDIRGGYTGVGNISSDPLFSSYGHWDGNEFIEGDYHLRFGSPCIDSGTASNAPGYDIEGTPRPQGAGYDMGAYEYRKICTDSDGDGYYKEGGDCGEEDCDDSDDSQYPGATETCDGKDNDCDGEADEGVLLAFYLDNDGDGYGDVNISLTGCVPPSGYVTNATDCNDNDAAVFPGAAETCNHTDDDCDTQIDEGVTLTFYLDSDGDGYGDIANPLRACTQPEGYVSGSGDCNDSEATIHPGAAETCNAADDNCNGSVDEGVTTTYFLDADGDGYGDANYPIDDCAQPDGYASSSTDCDDGNPSISPAATEICSDHVDNDCDRLSDCDDMNCSDELACASDIDGDGVPDFEEMGRSGTDFTFDGDGNGIPDYRDGATVSCFTYGGGRYITMTCPMGLSNVNTLPIPPYQPENVTFPFGFFEFTITVPEDGGSAEVTFILDSVTNTFYKYGPTIVGTLDPVWYEYLYDPALSTGAEFHGVKVVVHYVDGAVGDDDLTQNGTIVDQGGPGVLSPGGGSGDTGGSGGCSITGKRRSVNDAPAGYGLLIIAALVFGMKRRRKSQRVDG